MKNVQSQIKRMKQVYDIHTDKALADTLGKDKNTVSAWKKRGAVPIDVLRRVSLENTVSLDWLITGEGSMHLSGDSMSHILKSTLGLDDDEVLQRMRELLEDQETREMIELLPYATKEFIEAVKNRLEEFKKLSKI